MQPEIKIDIDDKIHKLRLAELQSGKPNLFKVGSIIKAIAQNSLDRHPPGVASAPGSPPHTHPKVLLKRSIRFSVDGLGSSDPSVTIGPESTSAGQVANLHEFGGLVTGKFGGRTVRSRLPKRPFMGPAVKEADSRGVIPKQWQGTIGG